MGRATRWLKALLSGGGGGSSSGKKNNKACPSTTAPSEPGGSVSGGVGGVKDSRKGSSGWGFARSFRDKDAAAAAVGAAVGAEPAGVRREVPGGKGSSCREVPFPVAARSRRVPHDPSCCSLSSSSSAAGKVASVPDEEEQSKRAIAVAAATAAAAEAAVAAAQAAAAVVRLTSRGGPYGPAASSSSSSSAARRSEEWAAVKIQSAFRGYLARRALKALKGLVKIQALVRGHIVRKQAAETMRCMQALVRVQARARAGRGLGVGDNKQYQHQHHLQSSSSRDARLHHHRHLGQGYNATHHETKDGTMAVNGFKSGTGRSNSLNRNGSRSKSTACAVDPAALQSPGWNWLDRWMEERYWDSRETLSRSGGAQTTDDERNNEKILEVDAGTRPIVLNNANCSSRSTTARTGHHQHQHQHHYSASEQRSRSYSTMLGDSPSKDPSTVVQQSIPSPSSVDQHPQHHQQMLLGNLRCLPLEPGVDYSDSPQFLSASSTRHGSSRRGPFTPSRSECSRSYFSGYADYPNYMSNTESSKAKLRSHSAPKQRPDYDKSCSLKRQQQYHLNPSQQYHYQNPAAPGVAGASGPLSSSFSMQLKFAGKAYPGSGRLDRMGMPIRI